MSKKTQLRIFSVIIFILAIYDLITLGLDIYAGVFKKIVNEDMLVQDIANITMLVALGCSVLSIWFGFYLSKKGMKEAKNCTGARLHIFVARLSGFFNLILFLILGLALLDSTDLLYDLQTLGICFVDMILMFGYAKAAKAVRKGEY